MAFTNKEIMELDNPYEQFCDGDALAENAVVLNALSASEQDALASRIIAACPDKEFKQYRNHIQALGHFAADENTFHSVLNEAYQVRQSIASILDPRNKNPHLLFTKKEFNADPFHHFSALAEQCLKNNETAIAERLALCTPADERSKVKRNLSIAFPTMARANQSLGQNIEQAFVLRHQIDETLLGGTPNVFFKGANYNLASCKKFMNMFRQLLAGHEEAIGKKLGDSKALRSQSFIQNQLDLLHTEAHDQTNPFKRIAESMKHEVSMKETINHALSVNPHGLFQPAPFTFLNVAQIKSFSGEHSSHDEDVKHEDASSNSL